MKNFLCFLVLVIFLSLASVSFAGVISNVSCPADKPVEVSFQWKSSVNITVASNTDAVVLPETPVGVFSSFKIPAYSGASGIVPVAYSSGVLQSFSCSEVLSGDTIFTYENLMFFYGIVIGVIFFQGVRTRV